MPHQRRKCAQRVTDIHTWADRGIGELLVSEDQQATLVNVDLASDFEDLRNWDIVRKSKT